MQEDRIGISIEVVDHSVHSVHVLSRKNLQACHLFHGREAEQVLQLLPMIYHVCGRAHMLAAGHAMTAACGNEKLPGSDEVLLLQLETLREHARRILLDWPLLFELPADTESMRIVLQQLEEIEVSVSFAPSMEIKKSLQKLQASIWQIVFASGEGVEPCVDDVTWLYHWIESSSSLTAAIFRQLHEHGLSGFGQSDIQTLSIADLDDYSVEELLAQDCSGEFVSYPHLRHQVYETGPLARLRQHEVLQELLTRYGNGLLTRFSATLIELSLLPQQMMNILEGDNFDQLFRSVKTGEGMASVVVEAARGCLWHRVEMKNRTVSRYQILAPTEWNFHPAGALVKGIQGITVNSRQGLVDRVRLMSMAMDPCVACDVEVI